MTKGRWAAEQPTESTFMRAFDSSMCFVKWYAILFYRREGMNVLDP